ncbi:MAG: flagellin [Methanoregula sp.]|jgi:flagellar protein FlaG|uniref:flagellin n=1 Tax=Methanoregula sp. TaxID=2052170 RepID=UPI003D0C39F8
MSADTFTTAIFLITAVVAAAVLINAIFPVVYQMAGTFSSSTHASDVRLRTDFVVVATFASSSTYSAQVFMKNVGSQSISINEIGSSDVIFGPVGTVKRLDLLISTPPPPDGKWTYTLSDLNRNNYWDPGETLEIDATNQNHGQGWGPGTMMYFQFILPNGVSRSSQFTSS